MVYITLLSKEFTNQLIKLLFLHLYRQQIVVILLNKSSSGLNTRLHTYFTKLFQCPPWICTDTLKCPQFGWFSCCYQGYSYTGQQWSVVANTQFDRPALKGISGSADQLWNYKFGHFVHNNRCSCNYFALERDFIEIALKCSRH